MGFPLLLSLKHKSGGSGGSRVWLCICDRVHLLQVALLVAAEFWEQGDLERTVLQQNPIVSREGVSKHSFFLTQRCDQ